MDDLLLVLEASAMQATTRPTSNLGRKRVPFLVLRGYKVTSTLKK